MPAPGRNSPCPCGSGRKYKQCCLARERPPAPAPADPRAVRMVQSATELHRARRYAEAEAAYRAALAISDELPEAWYRLGLVLGEQGRVAEAEACYRRVLALRPDDPDALYCLGQARHRSGRSEEAIALLRQALALRPRFAGAYNTLGLALEEGGGSDEAIASYRKALAIEPGLFPAMCNLGAALMQRGLIDEAVRIMDKAVAAGPGHPLAHLHLGDACLRQGDLDRAMKHLRRALALGPDIPAIHDSFLMALNYLSTDPGEVAAAHRTYGELVEGPLRGAWRPHDNDPDPARRLRIGYVSPDFRQHSVAVFFEPLLSCHDRSEVEVFAYYCGVVEDGVTERLRAGADHWRACDRLTDAGIAARIRADRIDILVDLAGHTSGNRLSVFAHRPAPVQVSWLGYPATTGLTAIDYRLVSAATDPPGAEAWHSEGLWRLPHTLWSYRPDPSMPPVEVPAPVHRNGRLRLFCGNNVAKISDATVEVWARILEAVPASVLTLSGIPDGQARTLLGRRFAARGVDAGRLEIFGKLPASAFHALLADADVALDPFPYNGTTTTCDCLWMGLPVVAMTGAGSAARAGAALLDTIGLGELAARDEDDYVRIACDLARDLPRLDALRASLRTRIEASPLRDEAGFARAIEAAFRAMWVKWSSSRLQGADEHL